MPSIKSVLTASAVAFLTSANAHMILLTPPPYGTPDSSPLEASGANYPCKGATSAAGGTVTEMPIGSKQTLTFKGSAVHGGGSCQVSLTKDNPATKSSKFEVIHSIEGGCPARGQAGNAGGGSGATGSDKYDYTIPQGLNPGTYTLAWTWFNKIGNREMYMNCASVKISGGSSKRDTALNETYSIPELLERAATTFPPMFVANIPATDCTTVDSQDLQFPDPGASVEKAGTGSLAPPKGPKCGAPGTSGDSKGSAATGSDSGSAPASPSAPSSGSASGAPDSQSAAAGGSTAMPSAAAPAASAAAPSAASNSSSSGSGSSSGGSAPPAAGSSTGTCSQPGQSICSPDGKQIGTCTATNTVTWIPVAAGTKCSGGIMVMAGSKRSAKFAPVYNFPRLR